MTSPIYINFQSLFCAATDYVCQPGQVGNYIMWSAYEGNRIGSTAIRARTFRGDVAPSRLYVSNSVYPFVRPNFASKALKQLELMAKYNDVYREAKMNLKMCMYAVATLGSQLKSIDEWANDIGGVRNNSGQLLLDVVSGGVDLDDNKHRRENPSYWRNVDVKRFNITTKCTIWGYTKFVDLLEEAPPEAVANLLKTRLHVKRASILGNI